MITGSTNMNSLLINFFSQFSASEKLEGTNFDDIIYEGSGHSEILGGSGEDTIHITVGGENDLIDSGDGDDTIIVENAIG